MFYITRGYSDIHCLIRYGTTQFVPDRAELAAQCPRIETATTASTRGASHVEISQRLLVVGRAVWSPEGGWGLGGDRAVLPVLRT